MKSEEGENGGDDASMPDVDQPPQAPVITRAGRQSKTATPLSSTFPEQLGGARGRAARGTGSKQDGNNAGSHASSESGEQQQRSRRKNKGASANNTTTTTGSAAPSTRADDASDLGEEAEMDDPDLDDAEMEEGLEGEDGGGDEPKYCYCNDVSYGEMVACDNEDCAIEWFHLKCAGLSRAPDENSEFIPFLSLPLSHEVTGVHGLTSWCSEMVL